MTSSPRAASRRPPFRAVAARAGVATGSVYRHFPSKAELLAEAFRRASQREVDAVGGGRTRSRRAVEVFVRRALAAPVRAYALIAEPRDPAVEAERLAFRRAYAEVFACAPSDRAATRSSPPPLVGALGEALVGPLAQPRPRPGRARRASCSASVVNAIRGAPMSLP